MKSLVRALVGLLAALIGLTSIASAEATSVPPHMTYAYDSQHHNSVPTEATNERGPPGWDATDNTAHAAVDSGPHSASARPDGAAPPVPFVHDHTGLRVLVTGVRSMAHARVAAETEAPPATGERALPQRLEREPATTSSRPRPRELLEPDGQDRHGAVLHHVGLHPPG